MSGVGMGFGRERGMLWLVRGRGKEECLSVHQHSAILSTDRNKAHENNNKWAFIASYPRHTAVFRPFRASDANILFKYFIFHPLAIKKQVFKVKWIFLISLNVRSHELASLKLIRDLGEVNWGLNLSLHQLLTHIAVKAFGGEKQTKNQQQKQQQQQQQKGPCSAGSAGN